MKKFWSCLVLLAVVTSGGAFLVDTWQEEWEWENMTDVAPGKSR